MNYAEIKYYDIANGPGVRTSLFVSGCTHRCKGCFNEEAWDFTYGSKFDGETANKLIESCKPDYIAGLSLLGGEPFEPENQRALLPFLREFRTECPGKTVWCYSGYTYEELIRNGSCRCESTDELLELIDVLVDGEFVQELYDISLRFRGSSNQRIIDMKSSRMLGSTAIWRDDPVFERQEGICQK